MLSQKLQRCLKNEQIPNQIIASVTLQYMNEKKELIEWEGSRSELDPVVGLIFKGVPKWIIRNFALFSEISNEVLTSKYRARYMEPIEKDWTLRILLETPIYSSEDIAAMVQRMKQFLPKQGALQSELNKVIVMSFSQDQWDRLKLSEESKSQRFVNPDEYVGVVIENMPASIADSDIRLESLERLVFPNQKVAHIRIMDTTLRITFGVCADKSAIEQAVRDLKRALSQMGIPAKQINNVIVIPHRADTWGSSPRMERKAPIRQKKDDYPSGLR